MYENCNNSNNLVPLIKTHKSLPSLEPMRRTCQESDPIQIGDNALEITLTTSIAETCIMEFEMTGLAEQPVATFAPTEFFFRFNLANVTYSKGKTRQLTTTYIDLRK